MKSRILLCLGGLLLASPAFFLASKGYRASFYGQPRLSATANASSVESSGLLVTVKEMRWQADKLRLKYALEWVTIWDNDTFVFRRSFGTIKVVFYDEDEGPMGKPPSPKYSLTDEFLSGEARTYEGEIVVAVPKDAKRLTISLGGIETNPVDIPRASP